MNPAYGRFAKTLKDLMPVKRYDQSDEISGMRGPG
jgi:hypothetical protein